jgi:imidazole glycerol-phosphate synthase subunit HisH
VSSAAPVAIIDSGGANLASLRIALERLGASTQISADAKFISRASRVLLPGVGAAGDAMRRLRSAGLDECIRKLTVPVLGICLGMQLLYAHCEEDDTETLGILSGSVRRMRGSVALPVPHMGWNSCTGVKSDPLLAGISGSDYFYFVHSYAAPVDAATQASVEYGGAYAAVARRNNFCGVQFHPERSAQPGARLLRNFMEL